jgi:hypothetical protein
MDCRLKLQYLLSPGIKSEPRDRWLFFVKQLYPIGLFTRHNPLLARGNGCV